MKPGKAYRTRIQAKNVSDELMIATIGKVGGNLFDIQDALFPLVPRKVVLAKLRSMLRRFILDGCDCGCMGAFKKRST